MVGFTHLSKRIACGWLIATIILFYAICTISPAQADSDDGNGPGGVGSKDGTSSLTLWLKANAGVYTDDACTTAAGDGNSVACWADQSGNGNHFTQSTLGYRPSFTLSSVNNQPALQFDGISQYLEKAFTANLNTDNFTVYIVARAASSATSYRSPFASHCSASGYMFYAADNDYWNFWISKGSQWSKQIGYSVDILTWHILTGYYDSSGNQNFDIDETNMGNNYPVIFTKNPSCPTRIGAGETQLASPGAYFPGSIAEIIVFNTSLTLAERTLVDNYLNAKYNITIINDKYSEGDPPYTWDVAGIGQDSDGSSGVGASGGMTISDDGFLQDNGDYILIGHIQTANNVTSDDLPTNDDWADGNNQRWSRIWYLQKIDEDTEGGTVDITFDISDSGMSGSFAGSAGNYRLLKRSGSSGDFSDIGSATSINGDQVLFDNVDSTILGSYFTLGTVDNATSPTAVSLWDFGVGHPRNNLVALLILLAAFVGLYLFFGWRRRL